MAREVKTAYGVMTAEKTANGYTVTAPCGTHIGEVEYIEMVVGKMYYARPTRGGGRTMKSLKEACTHLMGEFLGAKIAEQRRAESAARIDALEAQWKAEIEAADADAQAVERVAAEAPADLTEIVEAAGGKVQDFCEFTSEVKFTIDGVTFELTNSGSRYRARAVQCANYATTLYCNHQDQSTESNLQGGQTPQGCLDFIAKTIAKYGNKAQLSTIEQVAAEITECTMTVESSAPAKYKHTVCEVSNGVFEHTMFIENTQDACRVCGGASKDGEALVHDYLCDGTNDIAQQDKLATRRAACKKCAECGHSWRPAKCIVGKPDGSAEVTTAAGVTTIAPRGEHADLEDAHGVRITSPDIPASGVDAEYYIDKDSLELGKIYFVEGAGYAPMRRDYKRATVKFYSVAGKMLPTMGEALQQLLHAVKENGMPDNPPKVRTEQPKDDLAQAQAALEKVDSLIGLNKWFFEYGAKFDLFWGHDRIAAFGAFEQPQYIYVRVGEHQNLVLQSRIGATLTAKPKPPKGTIH